jgi:colicin import membrane protein
MVDTFAPPEPETIIPISREEAMASDVAQALANATAFAKPRPRGMPAPSVTGELQALTELAKTDPSIADRYALGSQELQDIATQVESFSEPTVEWTPPAKQEVRKTEAPTQEQQAATVQALDVQRENLLRIEEKKEEQRQQAAADRAAERENQRIASKASAAAKRAEKKKITAEKKVQAAFTAKVEKKKKEDAAKAAKQMQEFMQWSAAEHKRHQEEQRLRELRGFGWGAMMT